MNPLALTFNPAVRFTRLIFFNLDLVFYVLFLPYFIFWSSVKDLTGRGIH